MGNIARDHVSTWKRFYVAVCPDGRVLGHSAVHVEGEIATMFRVATSPEAARSGVASLLLNRVEEFACSMLCTKLELTTGANMAFANQFYVAKGFECVRRSVHPSGRFLVNHFERALSLTLCHRFGTNRICYSTANGAVNAESVPLDVSYPLPKYLLNLYGKIESASAIIKVKPFKKRLQLAMEHCYRASWQSNFEALDSKLFFSSYFLPSLPLLTRVISTAFYENLQREFVREVMSKDLSDPISHYRCKGGELYLAVLGKKYVYGMVAVTAEGELTRLAVHPAARGKGIARLLCSQVEEHCRTKGHSRVFLTTGGWMKQAIGLYDALGYDRGKLLQYPLPKGHRGPHSHIPIQEFQKQLTIN